MMQPDVFLGRRQRTAAGNTRFRVFFNRTLPDGTLVHGHGTFIARRNEAGFRGRQWEVVGATDDIAPRSLGFHRDDLSTRTEAIELAVGFIKEQLQIRTLIEQMEASK